MAFKQATRVRAKLRLAIDGPAGSGKTYTSLKIARRLVGPTGRIAVIDTERGSASKYAGGKPFHFDVDEPRSFSPRDYVTSIEEAAKAGYDALVIDSLSHAWSGTGGALEIVDSHNDKFGKGWRTVTPMHNALIDAILRAPMHVIVTMRSKMEYVVDEKTKKISKVGLKPVQREGVEYEFDVVLDINDLHVGSISKSRCSDIADRDYPQPGDDLADALKRWLDEGDEAKAPEKPANGQATVDALLDEREELRLKALEANEAFKKKNTELFDAKKPDGATMTTAETAQAAKTVTDATHLPELARIEVEVMSAVYELDLQKVNEIAKGAPGRTKGANDEVKTKLRALFTKAREDIAAGRDAAAEVNESDTVAPQ